jgi:hypothetical protein
MKKLLLLFVALLSFFAANAQYRFYAGLEGGPNLSCSNSTVYLSADQNTTNYKIRHTRGVFAGYFLPGNKFSIEGGYGEQFHCMVLNFNKDYGYPAPPQITINTKGTLAKLILKTTLNKPDARIRLRLLLGGGRYWPYPFLDPEKNTWDRLSDKSGFFYFPYAADKPESFAFRPESQEPLGDPVWMLLTGLEAELKLSDHLDLGVASTYQNGLNPVYAFNIDYTSNFQKQPNQSIGTSYEPLGHGGIVSKAEALNLNIGLIYSFSKRNIAKE